MPHRRLFRILVLALSAVLLAVSVRFGFADAWLDQYAVPASAELQASPEPGDASAAQASESGADVPIAPKPAVLSNRVTEYHISVVLGDDGTLTGRQTVTWRNPGRKPVSEIYLHLYPNAFSPGSTFLKESGGQLRGDRMKPGSYGSMTLTALTTEQGETLLPRLHYTQPDDGNASDRTLATFRLPEPVGPGEKTTLLMEFKVQLPQVFARMGKAGDFVMAGQWFPKIAVYEPAGTRGRASEGWNTHQYHGNSEFYSDFGIYSVRIDVPEKTKVAATGFQTRPAAIKDGRKIYQFYADDVHDFGWAASPSFHFVEDSFSSVGVPGVRIKLYIDPLHKDLADRYMHAAKSALAKLGEWYGDYPYSTLSIIVPPADANGAGGMEYPTLITAGAAKSGSPGYDLERTVVHEIAHQYWYGIVASNEFEEAWLDEGFTSYTEDKLMASIYGVAPNPTVEASYMTHPEPLKLDSWRYSSSDRYAENVYMRGKLVLKAMEKQLGEKTMNKIMRSYFQKYRFKHPSTADFQKVAENVTKAKWNDFFQAYVYHGQMADFAVESIRSEPAEEGGYRTTVLLRRNGGSPQPVTVMFQFADGSTLRKTWDGVQNHVQVKLNHARPLSFAAIDPSNSVILDNLRYNNYLKAEVPEKARTRLNIGLSKIIDGMLGILAW
ncbi:M1 family metallopeptidase [Cohnella xylanilytica]|uniref:M1 family metallopeptidase n=1 Tax=Cohnella xylanilytica TaxID=557555 RepID=A0A841U132_9BACL|nr:M1 family metallopeptidase [Cohnella xylanilytica]MBB6691820.1 M1 family metallopeptidase [Cohnella xylanilytica]